MVGAYVFVSEPVTQMAAYPLGHPSRVDKNQRSAMLQNECRKPVVYLLPDLERHNRFQRRVWDLDSKVKPAAMPSVDDAALRSAIGPQTAPANQEASDLLDGS